MLEVTTFAGALLIPAGVILAYGNRLAKGL